MQKNLRSYSLFVLCFAYSFFLSAQPEVDFYFELPEEPTKLVAPVQVSFINVTIGENLDYDWTLNGELFSIEEEPQKFFAEAGMYVVCLEAKNQKGTNCNCQTLEFFNTIEQTGLISVSK